ncbi:hypothetical protein SARC_04620 [Sphaeroforma arctica JP610]|uniref:Uncharacterized protein n=1 Tax=Sphaeroforma arctica JP610 TaxID=667725 RepID=A0A0L0G1W7_9EUKA|nr:hypothetical protein SARC_04620 [Sphaeroforma arctica JP610]KNC83122.1 hypothetical protein SARC_04620 [Sphaeroforma arctica JP610]|eukprot:XP_014157024.1 hypothetical protein SARC_04620 [Sphaeroforma arctica JP610]
MVCSLEFIHQAGRWRTLLSATWQTFQKTLDSKYSPPPPPTQWQDISHTFGDQLRGRGRCTDCATKIQSIQQGLSEVNLEGLLTAPVDLDPEKQYVPPPTNPGPAVIQDDGEGAGDTDASETPEDTANAAGSVAEVSTSLPATVKPAAPIDTDTPTPTDPELLRFEGPLEVHPDGTCTTADANNLFQARLALDTACPTKKCDQTCGDAYAKYNDSYAHCADSISPPRTLAVMEAYLSICSAAGYQQPAGNFTNTKNSAKPTDVKPGSTRPQQTSTWTPLPRERCGEVMRQELQTVLSTCGTFISGDSDCIQPCAVQLNAIQTQWSQCVAAKADMGVGEAETGQLEWLLQHCVAEKVVRLQRVRTILVKLLWGVKGTRGYTSGMHGRANTQSYTLEPVAQAVVYIVNSRTVSNIKYNVSEDTRCVQGYTHIPHSHYKQSTV